MRDMLLLIPKLPRYFPGGWPWWPVIEVATDLDHVGRLLYPIFLGKKGLGLPNYPPNRVDM